MLDFLKIKGAPIVLISLIALVGVGIYAIMKREEIKENKNAKIAIGIGTVFLVASLMIGAKMYSENHTNITINEEKTALYTEYMEDNEDKFNFEVEYGEEIVLWYDEGKFTPVKPEQLKVKDTELGEYEYEVIFKDEDDFEWMAKYKVKIVDTEAPVITGVGDIETEKGEEVNLSKLAIKATDKVDGEVPHSFKGDVDFNKSGKYTVTVTAVDKSGNKADKTFTVTVIDNEVKEDEDETTEDSPSTEAKPGTPKPQPKPEGKPKPESKPKPTPQPNKPAPKPQPKPEPKPQPKPEPKPEPTPQPSAEYLDGWARDMHAAVNRTRRENGLSELAWNDNLAGSAKIRAKEISTHFSHTRPDGSEWWTVNEAWGHGENLAYGQADVASAMRSLMASPSHQRNILDEEYKGAAYAVYKSNGTLYYVQLFTLK